MTNAWVALGSITLSSASSSVTFGSIPSGYRDLSLVVNQASSSTSANFIGFNGNSYNSNLSGVRMAGISPTQVNSSTFALGIIGWGPQGGNSGAIITQIMDYSDTSKHTTFLSRSNSDTWVTAIAGRWASTAAVTSITLTPETANYAAGSTFTLYGSNRL